jgi:peptidoglycan/LPS O-acetylase OafA/YrhL
LAFLLILAGGLEVILEFGSVTFLVVSLLMAFANYRIRDLTKSSTFVTLLSFLGLLAGTCLILYYEYHNQPRQLVFILALYTVLAICSWLFSRNHGHRKGNTPSS